jgi:2-polyprenyl-6-methoxyphenol hydroxylase-like FAD-dependent oxidoreductase
MWRVIYQDSAETDDELVANAQDRIGKLLASSAEAPPFEVISARPYRIHQRLVTSMVKNRVILAADAAHLCCP